MEIKAKTVEKGTRGRFAKEFQVVGRIIGEDEGFEGFHGLSDNLLLGKVHIPKEGLNADALMQCMLVPDTQHVVTPDDNEAVCDLWGV